MIKKTKGKKSQTEMMGLVIVVILITLAMLFVVSFIVLRKPSTLKKQYTQSEIAANTLYALLETTTPCSDYDYSVRSLFEDCALYDPGSVSCDGMLSCEYIEAVADEIFEKTLRAWNINFEFTAIPTDIHFIYPNVNSCRGEKRSQSQPITVGGISMTFKLDICD